MKVKLALIVTLIAMWALLGCLETLKRGDAVPLYRTIRLWDQVKPDKNDFKDILIPGWMPDFYVDYIDNGFAAPIGYGLMAFYCPDKDPNNDENRDSEGVLKAKWYTLIIASTSPNVSEIIVVGLEYDDDTVDPGTIRTWLYVNEKGEEFEDGLPQEVDKATWDCTVNMFGGMPCGEQEEEPDPRDSQKINCTA